MQTGGENRFESLNSAQDRGAGSGNASVCGKNMGARSPSETGRGKEQGGKKECAMKKRGYSGKKTPGEARTLDD